jgi:putative membrane protein
MTVIINILLLSVAIFLVATLMPTIKIKSYGTAIVVALVYSVINFLVGWLLTFIALPLIWITFGLFKLVINAVLLWMTDQLVDDFKIKGIGSTLVAAVLITVIDSVLKWMVF